MRSVLFLLLCLSINSCQSGKGVNMAEAQTHSSYIHPKNKIQKLGTHTKKIWVVGYTNEGLQECIEDLENSFNNGADAIVFEGHDYKKMDGLLAEIRKLYPQHVIGVNFLGSKKNLHTYKETFSLAKKHKLQIAWTDFSGVDLIKEAAEVSLHDIEKQTSADVFYVSGVHMKYSTLIDAQKTIEKSALQAMGWVDGVTITGPQTGVSADLDKVKRVKAILHDYPMGLASGVSAENVKPFLPYIDYVLVNTSIADKNHRVIPEKLRALRSAMGK